MTPSPANPSETMIPNPWDLPFPLRGTALARPQALALKTPCEQRTFAALDRGCRVMAAALRARGVKAGQRVALTGQASALWVEAFHALGWIGACVAPLPPPDTRTPRADWLRRFQAADCEALLVVGPDAARAGLLRRVHPKPVYAFAEAPDLEPESPELERFWPLDEERVVIASSGSTGRPKAIPIRSGQWVFSVMGSSARLGHELSDRWLCCLPLYHVGGLMILVRSAWMGSEVELLPRFDAARVADSMTSGPVSLISLVPAMLESCLAALNGPPHPRLRAVVLGGAAASPDLLQKARALDLPVTQTWGMSEGSSMLSCAAPGEPGLGAPLPFVRLRLAAPNGGDEVLENTGLNGAPEYHSGARLILRGPLLAGQLESQDLGRLNESGQVEVFGRADEVIISGGLNVALPEIEKVLRENPAVQDVAVVAVSDERWGQRPVACVVSKLGEQDLRRWCEQRLARYKIPDRFVLLKSIPRTELGKLRRAELPDLDPTTIGAEDGR